MVLPRYGALKLSVDDVCNNTTLQVHFGHRGQLFIEPNIPWLVSSATFFSPRFDITMPQKIQCIVHMRCIIFNTITYIGGGMVR